MIWFDNRVPGVAVQWEGGASFEVRYQRKAIDVFTWYGDAQGSNPTALQAEDAATDFFDRLVSGQTELRTLDGDLIADFRW